LASSRFSSNTPDSVDVLAVMVAFEEINNCRLEVSLTTRPGTRLGVMVLQVTATRPGPVNAVPVVLAYRRSLIGYHHHQPMEAAILQALYGIDRDLDGNHLASEPEKP